MSLPARRCGRGNKMAKMRNHNVLMEQLPLFLDEHVILNSAMQDLQALRLEEAKNGFEQFHELYPRGESVAIQLQFTDYLMEGLKDLPEGSAGAMALCRLWQSFSDLVSTIPFHESDLIAGIKQSLFLKAVAMLDSKCLAVEPFLPDQTPAGFIYLMAGQLDNAIFSLQAALPRTPHNAHIYAYLGDVHCRRGDTTTARSCYLEALLINPEAVDWMNFQDTTLLALKQKLQEEQGLDSVLAAYWLSSHAYVAGLFRPKEITQLDVLKTMVDEYVRMEKDYARQATSALGASLFIRSIILCDNEAFLRMVKGFDFASIRLKMREINAPLFSAYMKAIDDRGKPRSEWRKP